MPALSRGGLQLGGVGAARLGALATGERPSSASCPRRGPCRAARGRRPGGLCSRRVRAGGRRPSRRARRGPTSSCSPSAGGGRCSVRPPACALSSKRSGGPGSSIRPSTGWSTSITRPWERVWSQLVDPVEGADLAGGDTGLGQLGQQLGQRAVGEGGVDGGVDGVAVADPLGVGGHPRRVAGRGRTRRELPPQALAAAPRSAACRPCSGTGRRGRSRGGGCPGRAAPRRRRSSGCPGRRARRRWRRAGGADDAPAAGARCARAGRRRRRTRRTCRRAGRRSGTPTRVRVVGVGAGQRHQPGLALGDLVVARAAALGAVVAEPADRQDDQAGVELVQPLDREAEPVQHAGAEVLQQDVGVAHQAGQDAAAVVALEVERDGLLVAVAGQEVRRDRVVAPARRRAVPNRGCRRRCRGSRP